MKYGKPTRGQDEAILNKIVAAANGDELILDKIFSGVVVNYDRSIADLVGDGRYDLSNDLITDQNFPSDESGEKEVEMVLFHFNQLISSKDAIEKMKREGCRPATMKELLVFEATHPDVQKEFPIVALGSVARVDGDCCVGFLNRDDSRWRLRLSYFDDVWDVDARFLAVRN